MNRNFQEMLAGIREKYREFVVVFSAGSADVTHQFDNRMATSSELGSEPIASMSAR
jgi:hypothetical protein